MASLMNVNGRVSSSQGESKTFRLPRMYPFPKLDGRTLRVGSTTVPGSGAVLQVRDSGMLPEMTTDVIDQDANYAVENVKRNRPNGRLWAGVGLGRLLGQMLGGHRTVRP